MIDKINVGHIVSEHFRTLRSFQSKRWAPGDLLLFLGMPLFIAGALVLGSVSFPDRAIGILATGLAIFAGLLFNLLLLVADIAVRTDDSTQPPRRRSQLRVKVAVLAELHSNIAFSILLSLICLVTLIGLSLRGTWSGRWVLEGIAYYLSTLFFLTLLMILKRAHALIAKDVRDAERIAS